MSQATLFGEAKQKVTPSQPEINVEEIFEEKPHRNTIIHKPKTHPKEMQEFVKQCEARGEKYAYTYIDTNPNDKKGKEPFLITRSYESSTDNPSSMTYCLQNWELFLTHELQDKYNKQSEPFAKDVPNLRNTPIGNDILYITDQAKKTLENHFKMTNQKVDIDKIIKEHNEMKENEADDRLVRLCIDKDHLEQEIAKLNSYTYNRGYGTLKHIQHAIMLKFGITGYSYDKPNPNKIPLHISTLTPDQLLQLRKDTIQKLKDLNEDLKNIEREISPDQPERCYGISNINDNDWDD